jgi:hypothetical protein
LTSPCSHANGLCFGLTTDSVCQNGHIVNGPPSYAFERSVMRHCVRAASALDYCAPAARSRCHRAAAQRGR